MAKDNKPTFSDHVNEARESLENAAEAIRKANAEIKHFLKVLSELDEKSLIDLPKAP